MEPRDRSSGVYTTQVLDRSSGIYNSQIMDRHTPPIAANVPAPPLAPSPTAALLASEAAGRRNQRREEERTPSPPATKERPPPPPQKPALRPAGDVPAPASFLPSNVRDKERRERTTQDVLHEELRAKMSGGPPQHPPGPPFPWGGPRQPAPLLTPTSTPREVVHWLEQKGFSAYCVEMYGHHSGRQLLQLGRAELERVLSPNEATKLEDNLSLQRDRCGLQSQEAGAELSSILHRRKAAVDTGDSRRDSQQALGHPPSFRPLTPTSLEDDSNSEGSANDLANTGKTLRDLLIRQRKKIVSKDVFSQHVPADY